MEAILTIISHYPVLFLIGCFFSISALGSGLFNLIKLYLNHRLEMKQLEIKREKLLILKQVDKKQLSESKKEKTITAEPLSKEDLKLIELDILTKRLENI